VGRDNDIDKEGNVVIEAKYYKAQDFSDGLAAVQEDRDSLWGFIDKEEHYFLEPQYSECSFFLNGKTHVQFPGQKKEIINYIINKDKKIIWENSIER
jgi:hypothetical protein